MPRAPTSGSNSTGVEVTSREAAITLSLAGRRDLVIAEQWRPRTIGRALPQAREHSRSDAAIRPFSVRPRTAAIWVGIPRDRAHLARGAFGSTERCCGSATKAAAGGARGGVWSGWASSSLGRLVTSHPGERLRAVVARGWDWCCRAAGRAAPMRPGRSRCCCSSWSVGASARRC
jgi:hypothetical protein